MLKEEKVSNIKDALEITQNLLGDIAVPVKYKDSISETILAAIRNLEAIKQMVARNEEKEQEQTEQSEPIKLDAKITPIDDPQKGE